MNLPRTSKRRSWVAAATIVPLVLIAAVGAAADTGSTDDPELLKKTIEAQQRKLEAQQRKLEAQQQEIDAQRQMLQELLQRVETMTAGGTVTTSQSVAEAAAPQPAAPEVPAAEPDWPGSFSLFGSKTRLAVGGFVQLDVIHDSDAIGSPCQFITSTIPTDGGTMVQGADGQTSFCVNTSRLTFESRTPTKIGRLKTFISLDLFGEALSTSPSLRMRQAYGELEGVLWGGDLLFGQAWGTYVDFDAWPDLLDFEGPGAAIAVRQPMIRWSKAIADNMGIRIALEQPGNGSVQGADKLTNWPDLIGTLKWSHGKGHLRGAGIVRQIRVSANDGPATSATGWGLAGSGKMILPARSSLLFEVSYGEGVGSYYNDGPPKGVYDPTASDIELLPLTAYYVGFEHGWSNTLSTSILYSSIRIDNLDSQPDDAMKQTGYFSLNLIWRPDPALMFGAEFLSGGRRDKDGSEGTDNRIQLSSQFSF